jgi:hypothetical protein
MLLIFNNADEALTLDGTNFTDTIEVLLAEAPKIKILLSSRIILGMMQGVTQKLVQVQNLSPL